MSNTLVETQVQAIPLSQVHLNPANPRGFINPDTVNALAGSMAIDGQKTPIKVIALEDGQYQVVGGDHRVLAARQLEWEAIQALVLKTTPEQAFWEAYLDNQGQPMTWWADYLAIEAVSKQPGKLTQQQIADKTMTSRIRVNQALALLPLLNPASREAICRNSTNQGQKQVSEDAVFNLRPLATGQPDDPERIQAALQVVIDRQMTADQAKNWVKHLKAGGTAETFGQSAPVTPKAKPVHHPDSAHQGALETSSKLEVSSEELKVKAHPESNPTPSFFWEWMAGISFIAQIRSKLKKGETMTGVEKWMVLGWRFMEGVGGLLKHLKLIPEFFKFVWKLLKGANRLIEDLFGKTIAKITRIGLVLFLVWAIWFGPASNPLHQLKALVSKSVSTVLSFVSPQGGVSASGGHSETSAQTAPVATNLSTSNSELQTPNSSAHLKPAHHSHPMIPYQPKPAPYNPSDLDKNYFNQQLAGIPKNSLIKPYSFQPDFAMGSDMASHRLMDLQLREKYTVLWGTDKETVKSIYSGASNMTLTLQNGLVGVFLGGTDKTNIYWEDVKSIYCDVIESNNAKKTYEIFLVLSDSKKPLAIQCATGADLEHLVSALEFYIKLSGHNTAPVGSLPYLNQGVLFNNDREVTMLWADSPAGKTALTFGDILWSVEKNTDKQQTKTELETVLQGLTPGPHNIYWVKPAEWTRASKESASQPESFYPIRKVARLIAL